MIACSVKGPVTVDEMDVDEFIGNNADSIWLHQNEVWIEMEPLEEFCLSAGESVQEDCKKIWMMANYL
jgi:hypothetical protein